MDVPTKLHILADAAKYDAACASCESVRKRVSANWATPRPAASAIASLPTAAASPAVENASVACFDITLGPLEYFDPTRS